MKIASFASCDANHGAFLTSFAKPYPHTVAMACNQLGRKACTNLHGHNAKNLQDRPFTNLYQGELHETI